MYDIYRKHTTGPKSNMIKVNIGLVGEQVIYFGVYWNTESINKYFLEAHLDLKKGPLFKYNPNELAQDNVCDNSGLWNRTNNEQLEARPGLR